MPRYLVMASGEDRPGIVAAVTTALAGIGANLEDSSMTRLGGRFAMFLMVAGSSIQNAAVVRSALEEPAAGLGLRIAVDDVDAEPASGAASEPDSHFTVTVYGADHPGIVAAISSLLASAGANVCDLSTRLIGSSASATYTMLIEITLPSVATPEDLTQRLEVLASELDVTCHLQPVDVDTF